MARKPDFSWSLVSHTSCEDFIIFAIFHQISLISSKVWETKMARYSVILRIFAIVRCEYNILESSSNDFLEKRHICRALMYDFYVYIKNLLRCLIRGSKSATSSKSDFLQGPTTLTRMRQISKSLTDDLEKL